MISKRSNTASAKGRDIAPGVPAQKDRAMTVQDLINALEDQPKGCEVTALIWPSQGASGGYLNHVGVLEVATMAGPQLVVLRLANSL